jgi:putative acetyltransferase
VNIRGYQIRDTEAIMQLFYDTVHEVNNRDYSLDQVDAWAPKHADVEAWKQSLSSKLTDVAEADVAEADVAEADVAEAEGAEVEGAIVGFAELETTGHIDRFYCHKNWQRKGVGTQLLKQLESKAVSLGIKRLFVEASITAQPFFISQGFVVIKQQEVERRGQKFINFVMEKFMIKDD